MKRTFFVLLLVSLASAAADEYGLEKVWETEQILKTPESVIYNPADSMLYVSNINDSPSAKDSNGFISKVSLDGKIQQLKWASGLHAPKGSGIFKDTLYVTDIDHLVEIDMKSGKIMDRHPAPGAKFLNDVAIDTSGNVYVSDYSKDNSAIYRFNGKNVEVWAKSKDIKSPNGLWLEGVELFFGNTGDGSLKAINCATRKIRKIVDVGFGIDGLRADGRGNWLVSDWQGKTSLVEENGKITVLLDTTKSKINSADIEFVSGMNLLIIPTFFDNKVVTYKIELKERK
ncbi:MAG: SMP-30/gluconolactonase/LRE family protein [Gemmatimonadota bacterium]|nr:MAG: SMP-30/gluconolactonase/LRE family protein [Gemmatimonadota bacterium]